MFRFSAALLCSILAVPTAGAAAAVEERFTVMFNGANVGHLRATHDNDTVSIELRIDDNGRGPKYREFLRLGVDGLPVEWRITGTASMGTPVQERYRVRGAQATWKTLNDEGSGSLETPRIYVPNDSSPWRFGLWARALLRAPEGSMDALPGGTLRVEKLGQVDVEGRSLGAYAILGANLRPQLVLLRDDGSLFAFVDGTSIVLPQGEEALYEELSEIGQSLNRDALAKLAADTVHRFANPIYLRNVRVFDTRSGTLGERSTVVVFRDRIVQVGVVEPAPADAVVVEGEGGVLMPALIDAHTHLGAWSGVHHVAAGVTTVRDMGNDNAALLDLIGQIDAGRIIGPRVLRSGFIEGKSPFSANDGFVVDNLPLALEKVRWYADRGFTGLKIYNSVPPDWVAPLAAEAHRRGLRVMGHVPAFTSSQRVIRDGYDEITHINQLLLSLVIDARTEDTRTPFRFTALGERVGKLDLEGEPFRRLLNLMKERRTAVDPTMAVFGSVLLARPGQPADTDTTWLDHAPVSIQRNRKAPRLAMKPGDDRLYRATWEKLLAAIKRLDDEGIRILPGTDDFAGVGLHSELETYASAGIANARVLQLATLGAAQYFGLDREIGSVEQGKLADLILLEGNPLDHMRNIRKVRLVLTRGAAMFPSALHEAIGMRPFASPPAVHVPRRELRDVATTTVAAQSQELRSALEVDASSRILWQRVFSSPRQDWINEITPLRNGSYAVSGFLGRDDQAVEESDWTALLANVNAAGQVLWQRELGAGGRIDAFWNVQEGSDGKLTAAGFTSRIGFGGIDGYVAVLKADGGLLKENAFGGKAYDRFTDLAPASDEGFVLAGFTQSFGAGGRDVLLLGIDANGLERWRRIFGGTGNDAAYYIEPSGDSAFIVSGGSDDTDGSTRMLAVKIDREGNEIWRRLIGQPGRNVTNHGLVVLEDGRIILTGYSNAWDASDNDVVAATLSPSGEVLRVDLIGGAADERAITAKADGRGGSWVVGHTRSLGNGGADALITRYTPEKGFTDVFTTVGGARDDNGTAIQPLADGSLLVAGYSESLTGAASDAFLIRLEAIRPQQLPNGIRARKAAL